MFSELKSNSLIISYLEINNYAIHPSAKADGFLAKALKNKYRARFLDELKTYSLKSRKNGQPRNEGCVHELSDLVDINLNNPEEFARLVKEGIHLMYQKQTSAKVLAALQEYLKPKN